jgi:D-erythrulose 1-phosphate 3-epimerase
MKLPRIYLAIDNCFASKRWTLPREWLGLVADFGLAKVEASSDTEADPLYSGSDYMLDWRRDVKAASTEIGVDVVNLYSGHGTYATLGLGHPDRRIRDRMKKEWIKPMIETAADLGAGVGFYCHGFPHATLQEPRLYEAARMLLFDSLAEIAAFAGERGIHEVSVEQMYAPHQIPWTIAGTRELMREVYSRAGAPMYVTVDTGHACGQRSFGRPTVSELRKASQNMPEAATTSGLWLGSEATRASFLRAAKEQDLSEREERLLEVVDSLHAHPYLFSESEDGDPYAWLSALGAYSPIIHLQQVTKNSSAHEPFTPELNAKGAIDPGKVLQSIAASYESAIDSSLPPACESIFLTLEIFARPEVHPCKLLQQLADSVRYWRCWVPEDGRRIDTLLQSAPKSGGA